MWGTFFLCSAMLMIAWAYHVYQDAEDRRSQAATDAAVRLSQDVMTARKETFKVDEEFYVARRAWMTERDALASQVEDLSRRMQEQARTHRQQQTDALSSLRKTAEYQGLRVIDNGMGQIVSVQIVDSSKFEKLETPPPSKDEAPKE